MLKSILALFGVGMCVMFGGGCASKPKEAGFLSTYANLQRVDGSETFLRYVAPNTELRKYSAVLVDPIQTVFYDKSESKGIKPEDIQHLEQYLYGKLQKSLQDAGFKVVSDPGPDVLRLRVAITNLKPSTPALNILPQTKLTGLGLGQVSAEGELVDSQSGKQLAAAIQSDTGSRLSLSGLAKWGDVESVMDDWAKKLAKRLSDARDQMKQS